MNTYQLNLFFDLMNLAEKSDSFFFKDEFISHPSIGGETFRIFNYRLCSYSDFLNPGALECRGIMFEMDTEGNPIRLAAMPMHKFFNLYENPFTENVDFSKTTHIMQKEDGSLISSYMFGHELMLKSKGSLTSEQALAAMLWLHLPENEEYKDEIHRFSCIEHTVNFEWTSPDNRIVLGYEKPALVVLNVRNNITGGYLDNGIFNSGYCPEIAKHLVKDHYSTVDNVEEFVSSIPDMERIEGFVIRLGSQMIKVKTNWYLARHRAKDSINSPKRLFRAIVGEEIDDILSLFHDDPLALKTINDMVALVEPKYNHMIATVEAFYEENKELDRKDYAIKAKSLDDSFMGLYMNMYLGRKNDYKEFAQKYYELFIGKVDDES